MFVVQIAMYHYDMYVKVVYDNFNNKRRYDDDDDHTDDHRFQQVTPCS